MNEQDQIKALAELDGWEYVEQTDYDDGYWRREKPYGVEGNAPDYLASYDAIIPLMQEQPPEIQEKAACALGEIQGSHCFEAVWNAAPKDFCQALLRATGKWVE